MKTFLPTMNLRWEQKVVTNCTGNGEYREWETLGEKVLQRAFVSEDGEVAWKDIEVVMGSGFPEPKQGEQDPAYRSRLRKP